MAVGQVLEDAVHIDGRPLVNMDLVSQMARFHAMSLMWNNTENITDDSSGT